MCHALITVLIYHLDNQTFMEQLAKANPSGGKSRLLAWSGWALRDAQSWLNFVVFHFVKQRIRIILPLLILNNRQTMEKWNFGHFYFEDQKNNQNRK